MQVYYSNIQTLSCTEPQYDSHSTSSRGKYLHNGDIQRHLWQHTEYLCLYSTGPRDDILKYILIYRQHYYSVKKSQFIRCNISWALCKPGVLLLMWSAAIIVHRAKLRNTEHVIEWTQALHLINCGVLRTATYWQLIPLLY